VICESSGSLKYKKIEPIPKKQNWKKLYVSGDGS
jgi:hypothetical protein